MAGSTFLSLTNRVLERLNEVQLTSSNFSSATGVHAMAKTAVNDTIREIHNAEQKWPFNLVIGHEQILSADDNTYTVPAACLIVDWNSFTLKRDTSLDPDVNAKRLPQLDYDDWLQRYKSDDENAVAVSGSLPDFIVRSPDGGIIVSPYPDKAYTVRYNYWQSPSDLSAHSDTTTIPNVWDYVILAGALRHAYQFRENVEAVNSESGKFKAGLSQMRTVLINKENYVRDTRATNFQTRGAIP